MQIWLVTSCMCYTCNINEWLISVHDCFNLESWERILSIRKKFCYQNAYFNINMFYQQSNLWYSVIFFFWKQDNLCSRQRIISEKGVPKVEYYMFEEHDLIQRAAFECMCNLVMNETVSTQACLLCLPVSTCLPVTPCLLVPACLPVSALEKMWKARI